MPYVIWRFHSSSWTRASWHFQQRLFSCYEIFFRKCEELETNINKLSKTVAVSHSNEKEYSETHQEEINDKFGQVIDLLADQHDLLIEQRDREKEIQQAIHALTNKVTESQQDIHTSLRKTQEEINDYFLILDNHTITKINQIDNTLTAIFTRWEHQLEPFMNTSDKAHQHHQENFVKVKESFQELADNACKELSLCNQRLASMSEALAEHRDHYARDRRNFHPNHHRPYGCDTRSMRGLMRQAAYESRCGSHSHEAHPPRKAADR